MFKIISFTGADDSIQKPQELFDVSGDYPFIEWAILLSNSRKGTSRYPSDIWQQRLIDAYDERAKIAIHLCGDLASNLVYKKDSWQDVPNLISIAKRVQLNFQHKMGTVFDPSIFVDNIRELEFKEIILPYEQFNYDLAVLLQSNGLTASILFDNSHGQGLLTNNWPTLLSSFSCGYAGGLGPDKLREQLRKIQSVNGNSTIIPWVDMESSLRSNRLSILSTGDISGEGLSTTQDYFDLSKCLACARIFQEFRQ